MATRYYSYLLCALSGKEDMTLKNEDRATPSHISKLEMGGREPLNVRADNPPVTSASEKLMLAF